MNRTTFGRIARELESATMNRRTAAVAALGDPPSHAVETAIRAHVLPDLHRLAAIGRIAPGLLTVLLPVALKLRLSEQTWICLAVGAVGLCLLAGRSFHRWGRNAMVALWRCDDPGLVPLYLDLLTVVRGHNRKSLLTLMTRHLTDYLDDGGYLAGVHRSALIAETVRILRRARRAGVDEPERSFVIAVLVCLHPDARRGIVPSIALVRALRRLAIDWTTEGRLGVALHGALRRLADP